MTPEVTKAIEELKIVFGESNVEVTLVEGGGARVIIKGIDIGAKYSPSSTWMGFVIGFQYPRADVYPHYIDAAVIRVDGKLLGEGFSGPMLWENQNCLQISRRSNRLDPLIDTANTKLHKVIDWLKSR
jgi:hypothetical protein